MTSSCPASCPLGLPTLSQHSPSQGPRGRGSSGAPGTIEPPAHGPTPIAEEANAQHLTPPHSQQSSSRRKE